MSVNSTLVKLASLCLLLCSLLVDRPLSAADERPELGGRYLARDDSLGYDAYRVLDGKRQLQRRDEAKVWVRRGNEAQQSGPALDALATAIGLCPYFPEAWLRYAERHEDLGLYDHAEYCLAQVARTLRYEASDARRTTLSGEYYALSAVLDFNASRYSDCIASLEHALATSPNEPDLLLLKARTLGELDRYAEARAVVEAYDQDHPKYATALSILGNVEFQAGDLASARDAFARAFKYGMRGAIFDNDRGRLALALDHYDEARGHFNHAIELRPSFMEARMNLAVTERRAGNFQMAEQVLGDALLERPEHASAHFRLAELRREMALTTSGEAAAALRASAAASYDQALRHGHDPVIVLGRRASIAAEAGDLAQAERDLLKLSEDPMIAPRVIYLLGRVKKDQGEMRIALNLFDMAQQRGFDGAEMYSDRGEIFLRRGEAFQAVGAFESALTREPTLIITRVNLSIAHAQLGAFDAAERELVAAERLAPEHELVVSQRQFLDQLRGAEGAEN